MATPGVSDLSGLLGRTVDSTQGAAVLSIVSAMVSEYTRGQGFTNDVPTDGLRAVILSASARLLANPRGLMLDETVGPESVSYRSAFTGWTVAEAYVLNGYRKRAM